MSSAFPTGWMPVNLFEVCRPRQWKTISTKELLSSGYVVYGANGEIGFYSEYTHEKPTVMITCRGATCGNVHISKPFSYINGNAMALDDLNESICELKYVNYYLRSRGFEDVISGSAQPQITGEGLRKVDVPLAPLPEQKRIADKLDTVLARVDACRERLNRVPLILKRFRQSVLAAATSGKLTEDWREKNVGWADEGSPTMPEGEKSWVSQAQPNLRANLRARPLSEVADFISGFAYKSETFLDEGEHQVIKIANVKDGALQLEASKAYISDEVANETEKFKTQPGDILISMTGTKYKKDYGFVAVAPRCGGIYVNQRVGIIRPRATFVDSRFLFIFLRSEDFRSQFFEGETGGVNQGNVGSSHIKACEIPLPELQEQHEIVRRVETLFAFADRLEARLATARTATERLTPALLAKAFRGELVPQDPNDEPAAELLKRLAAAREQAPKAKRGGKVTA